MIQPLYDANKRLVCPCCHTSESVELVWTGGSNHFGKHEDDFVCGFCACEFTAVYEVVGIEIIEEGGKQNG